jgi:hypothetical protein
VGVVQHAIPNDLFTGPRTTYQQKNRYSLREIAIFGILLIR